MSPPVTHTPVQEGTSVTGQLRRKDSISVIKVYASTGETEKLTTLNCRDISPRMSSAAELMPGLAP